MEADCWWADEQESGDGGQNGKGLGEVLRLLHFGDECREQDLRYPEEGDVQDGIHAVDPSRAGKREWIGSDFASCRIYAVVAIAGIVLNARKDKEEKNRDGHAESCGG